MASSPTPEKPQNKVVSMLTDSEGNPSSMRALCVGSFLVAALLALAIGFDKVNFTKEKMDLILYFLIGAFGGKTGQKLIEKKQS